MKKKNVKKVLLPLVLSVVLLVGSGFKSDFFEIAKQVEIFTTLFKELNMNYVDETNPAALMDTAIKNMLDDLDPYTKFLNEQDVEDYKIKNAGEYSGIGAIVRSYNDKLLIVEPYKDYPADKAGLKAGDEIIQIGDIKVADFDENASELLKGANGTSVEVTYVRQGTTKTATIERAGVEVDAVPFYDMANENTGFIVLSRFNRKASSQVKEAIINLKAKGATQLILDLRGNPGGLLTEAIDVTNLFIPKGEMLVSTKSKVKKFNKEYFTKNDPVDLDIPLVVLINERSASASEIVSGSLQDLDRAVIVGARSFGKGLVQRPLKLTYGTQLKVTISGYFTPSGRCIQALDYSQRDEEGKAIKNTSFRNFKTRNGRTVQDGGGVFPDVEIASHQTNDFIKSLDQNNFVFDFATEYYYNHSFSSVDQFVFKEKDFSLFKDYIQEKGLAFKSKTEEILMEAVENEKELWSKEAQNKLNELKTAIASGKIEALKTYQNEIQKKITDELVTRYFYREGLYQYHLKNDDAILTAVALLEGTEKYASILK